jgi:hypothetical protein
MNKTMKNIAVIFAALLSVNVAIAATISTRDHDHSKTFGAQNLQSTSVCVIPAVDGERVPFPLRAANTKFELAENETYLLNGTLVQIEGTVYFKVDFDTQPWLATEKLLEFPYFPVDSMTAKDINKYSGALVQIAVVAQANDLDPTSNEEQTSAMKLNMILSPVAL